MPKQPQDHKPKQFTFKAPDANGVERKFTIPSAAAAQERLSGGDVEDALAGGDGAMGVFLVKALAASGASPAARAALRRLPAAAYAEALRAWGEFGDGAGASLGESSPSST